MGTWQNDGSLTKYTTAPNTRSLSVTSNLQAISNATKTNVPFGYGYDPTVTTTMAVLFYESPNGSVAVLSRLAKGCSRNPCPYDEHENPIYTGDVRNFSWIDKSPALWKICDDFVDLPEPPFVSSQNTDGTNFSFTTYCPEGISSVPSVTETIFSPLKNSEVSDIRVLSKYR